MESLASKNIPHGATQAVREVMSDTSISPPLDPLDEDEELLDELELPLEDPDIPPDDDELELPVGGGSPGESTSLSLSSPIAYPRRFMM